MAPGSGKKRLPAVDLGASDKPIKETASLRAGFTGGYRRDCIFSRDRDPPILIAEADYGSRMGTAMSTRSPAPHLRGHLLQWHILLSLFFCLTLALAPTLAEARAGSSYSGSGKSSSSSM